MTATMRAVVLDAPGPPEALRIRELPVPEPRPGWVLIRVKAFGINRSELHTRLVGLCYSRRWKRVSWSRSTSWLQVRQRPAQQRSTGWSSSTACGNVRPAAGLAGAGVPRSGRRGRR